MSLNALISIIIPTYNREHLIGQTFNSIKNQTYTNWECIVVDDGSTDDTEELLKTYIANDNRFKFYKRPSYKPKGANACRNFGFQKSKGEFINWFDSDDTMEANKLEVQVKALEHNQNSPYCICQTKWVDKNTGEYLGLRSKEITSTNRLEDYILHTIFWTTIAPLWRRNFLIENSLLFDESLHQSQEYDFNIRALNINEDYVCVNQPLVTLYRHDETISNNIYASDIKMESHLKVKDKIIEKHLHKLSSKGRLKFLEIQTLMFKDLLKERKFKFAKHIMASLSKTIKQIDISVLKKMIFYSQLILAYASYIISGRGYNILKPLK